MRERVREAAEATTPGWSQDRFFTYQCPLLEEGACSLHPVRPDACRGVSSYSVDACIRSIAAASQKRDEPIPKVREHAILRSLHAHGLWAALQAAGLPYTYYSLNQGLDRVLDTPEAEPRWLAGEDIFAGVPNDTMLEGQARAMVEATIRTLIAGATGKMPAPADMPEIASPLGLLRIRPEAPGDEAFRLALFVDTRPELALLPDAARDSIMQMQFRAQTQGHRAQHPNARHEIIEHAGRPVGRLLCERADGVLHLVDIALAPPLRNRGAGTAILSKLLADAKRERLRVRLMVASNNPHAARLYARLGFVQTAGDAMHAVMEWRDESLQPLSPAP
jgi:GNAT superfamily N-acetyltransferase